MTPLNLSKTLRTYKSGWVAVDKNQKVVAHAKSFKEIAKKAQDQKDVFLMPAAKDYFGYLTLLHG